MTKIEEVINSLSEEELDLLNSDPEMLAAFKTKFAEPEILEAAKQILPSVETLKTPIELGKKLGTEVEAGMAGIAELDKNLLPRMANVIVPGLNLKTQPFQPALAQAAETIRRIEAGQEPTTKAGKAGKFIGSFFTPTQIALQGLTAGLAGPAIKLGGKTAQAVSKTLAYPTEVAVPATQKAASEVIGALTDVPAEALQQIMANAPAVAKAPTFPVLAKQVAGVMGKLGDKIGNATQAANSALNDVPTIGVQSLLDVIKSSIDDIGSQAISANKVAKETLEALGEQLKSLHPDGLMSEMQVVEWIKKTLRKGINPNDPAGQVLGEKLSTVAGITNKMIKEGNKVYSELEGKVADLINLRDSLGDAMGLVKKYGQDWDVKNVAVAKLKGLLKPENVAATKEILDKLAAVPGMQDFVQAVKLTAAKEAISAPATGVHKLFGLGRRLPALGGILAGLVPGAEKGIETALPYAIRSVPPAANVVYQGLKQ